MEEEEKTEAAIGLMTGGSQGKHELCLKTCLLRHHQSMAMAEVRAKVMVYTRARSREKMPLGAS